MRARTHTQEQAQARAHTQEQAQARAHTHTHTHAQELVDYAAADVAYLLPLYHMLAVRPPP